MSPPAATRESTRVPAVETLSALSNAADLAGVSQEQLGSSLSKLNRSIAEAVSGSREQIDAFAGLGISVRDASGNIKATDVVLGEIADRFALASDGAIKTQYAVALFGKSGADLIPLLNEGSAGLKEFGASIGENFAKQSEIFNDNLTKIKINIQRLNEQTFSYLNARNVEAAQQTVEKLEMSTMMLKKYIDWVVNNK